MNPLRAALFAINFTCSAINTALYMSFGDEAQLLIGIMCGIAALICLRDMAEVEK